MNCVNIKRNGKTLLPHHVYVMEISILNSFY